MALYYLALAFQLWMLVDCVKRRADFYWYIVLLIPFGAWVYFFVVKVHDFNLAWLRRMLKRDGASTLRELRYRVDKTPSAENRIRLADALFDQGQYGEAADLFRLALESHPQDLLAMTGLGFSLKELGRLDEAITHLGRVVEEQPSFRDYTVCLELADAYKKAGRSGEATAVLEGLVVAQPTVKHRLALAEHLSDLGRRRDAQALLETALEDHEYSPPFIKRRDRRHAEAAVDLLGWLKS